MEDVILTSRPVPASQTEKIAFGILCIAGAAYCGIKIHPLFWLGLFVGLWLFALAWYRIAAVDYTLTTQRLLVRYGILTRQLQEIELFRVKDFIVTQSLTDRWFHTGDVSIISDDRSTPAVEIYGLANPFGWKEAIRKITMKERSRLNLRPFEIL